MMYKTLAELPDIHRDVNWNIVCQMLLTTGYQQLFLIHAEYWLQEVVIELVKWKNELYNDYIFQPTIRDKILESELTTCIICICWRCLCRCLSFIEKSECMLYPQEFMQWKGQEKPNILTIPRNPIQRWFETDSRGCIVLRLQPWVLWMVRVRTPPDRGVF